MLGVLMLILAVGVGDSWLSIICSLICFITGVCLLSRGR